MGFQRAFSFTMNTTQSHYLWKAMPSFVRFYCTNNVRPGKISSASSPSSSTSKKHSKQALKEKEMNFLRDALLRYTEESEKQKEVVPQKQQKLQQQKMMNTQYAVETMHKEFQGLLDQLSGVKLEEYLQVQAQYGFTPTPEESKAVSILQEYKGLIQKNIKLLGRMKEGDSSADIDQQDVHRIDELSQELVAALDKVNVQWESRATRDDSSLDQQAAMRKYKELQAQVEQAKATGELDKDGDLQAFLEKMIRQELVNSKSGDAGAPTAKASAKPKAMTPAAATAARVAAASRIVGTGTSVASAPKSGGKVLPKGVKVMTKGGKAIRMEEDDEEEDDEGIYGQPNFKTAEGKIPTKARIPTKTSKVSKTAKVTSKVSKLKRSPALI